MTISQQTSEPATGQCWCCGRTRTESQLLHLNDHPEVAVCFGCARFLRRRATEQEDLSRPSAAARGRSVVRRVRSTVMEHGWQGRPVVGPVLRWVDKHMP